MGTVKLRRKKIRKAGLLSMLFLICRLFVMPVAAEEVSKTDDTPVDFVLVLDCSGSMKDSDKYNLTTSAAKMFVDMLPAENARLSVIVFGNEYSDSYDLQQIDGLAEDFASGKPYGANQIKLARDLEDITTQELKQDAKNKIDAAMNGEKTENNYTPIGYALEAACKILQDHGSEPSSAAVILLSDGRITGQAENDSYDEGLKSHSVDRAVEITRANNWPVYCMELNFDGQNGTGNVYTTKRAVYEMRQHIPQSEEEHIELKSATEAQDEFADIFSKFFQVLPEPIEPMVIQNGESSREFDLGEMVAETNITLTSAGYSEEQDVSDISKITDIVVTDPNGTESVYNTSIEQQDRIITFDKDYITVKLMTPIAGKWKITAHGADGVEIGLYAVTIHEMDLQLTTTAEDTVLAKGSTVDFYASFVYHDNPYVSTTVYRQYPGTLYIDGPDGGPFQMEGSDKDYSFSYTFNKSGEYTIYAYVSDTNLFRNGRKESGTYTFSVGNIPTEAVEKIDDQEAAVGGNITAIDCSQYFTNVDNDQITYSVNYDQASGINGEIDENGVLTLAAGQAAGTYTITVGAKDPMMEKAAEQEFTLTVANQPMVLAHGLKDGDTKKIDFSYNADSLPKFLLGLAHVPEESEKTIFWSDYFEDPDGLPLDIEVSGDREVDEIQMSYDAESMHLIGSGEGTVVYTVQAFDGSDRAVSHTLDIKVNSCDAKALLWKLIRIPLLVILIILILIIALLVYAFTGKKIYGKWDVITPAKTVKDRRFSVTSSGKHAKCNLNRLLKDLNVQGDFPGVELIAGNKFGQKVTIKGFDKMNEVMVNGSRVTDPAKLKKLSVSVGRGRSITLVSASNVKVRLDRKA